MTEKVKQSAGAKDDAGRKGDFSFYVYCVGEADALAPLFDVTTPQAIEPDTRLEIVAQEELAAVVSRVPLADYDADALQEHLADATWTALRAMRHERVVEHFARRTGVAPLRFGAIYLKREGVERMLVEKREELRAVIARLEGREEWGLNLYFDRAKLLENITEVSPRLRELGEQAQKATPGQSYLLRKKIEALRLDEARAETKRMADEIERAMAELSDGAKRLRVMKDEASEYGEAAAKFAFLVSREKFDKFRRKAEQLADAHAPAGYRLELTGPWPAYNFI